ncbi:hypothetical protein [Mycobacterium sp.]|uniref:hypothetical protein n=1 Tax=Mycobacterium sp. TaxID=1785 RepID=UPI003BABF63A
MAEPVSPQQTIMLDQALIEMTASGGRVETRTPDSAVVVTGKPVNHLLHLLLSLFLCTLWAPVWLIVAATGGERRVTVSVDPNGLVYQRKAPLTAGRIIPIVLAVAWGILILAVFVVCISAFVTSSQ